MPTPMKNIIIAGAGGNVGFPILEECLKASLKVSVLTRQGSTSTFPENVRVITTDYSPSSLATALTDQDAMISLLGLSAIGLQYALVEAAVKSGVKRFLPSEFGIDNDSPQVVSVVPPFLVRKELVDTLKSAQAAGSPIQWTAVVPGLFIDWGLRTGFLDLDVEQRTAEIWDDGDVPFTVTTLAVVARTVVKLLTDEAAFEASRNRYIYTGSVTTTQKKLLDAVEKATDEKFEVTRIESRKMIAESTRKLKGGDLEATIPLVKAVAFARFDGNALTDLRKFGLFNEQFGIKENGEIKELVATVVRNWNELPYARYVSPTV